jgi:hypothetical protein
MSKEVRLKVHKAHVQARSCIFRVQARTWEKLGILAVGFLSQELGGRGNQNT